VDALDRFLKVPLELEEARYLVVTLDVKCLIARLKREPWASH
jgi:hypothetical protein